jgi:hypothetical protein
MWSREEILAEIRRYGEAHGGKIPGRDKFAELSGLGKSEYSRYWARWGDAVAEAGYEPNKLTGKRFTDDEMLERISLFVREMGHYPVHNEFKIKRRADPDFPTANSITSRLGTKQALLERLVDFGTRKREFQDVTEICGPLVTPTPLADDSPTPTGWVYLIRSGKFHKIGKANHVGRRSYEIGLQLPEKHEIVHEIETDDPFGIEAYWHNRFADKRQNGEWFLLTKEDIAAFKRRKKFM